MIIPFWLPAGGNIAGTEAKTNQPDIDISYDNTEPRYVYMTEMPSEKIVRAIPETAQTETSYYSMAFQKTGEYGYANAAIQNISQEELLGQKRYKKFLSSFQQHKGNLLPQKSRSSFELIAKSLSILDFKDCFVEYSEYSDMIDFSLLFENGLELTIGKYFTIKERDVVAYSVSYKEELVISNMIKLGTLNAKFNEILSEIG